MLAALKFREYRIFWLGNATSNIGIYMLFAGRLWLMHELTDSKIMLGILTFASAVPILLFSMWGGVVADRVNRVRLVTITRALFACTATLTGLLIAFDVILPWHLILISVINGILLSFDIPSRQAMVPNLLPREHLVNAYALQSMLGTGSAIIGPTFLPLIIKIWGMSGVFIFIGIAYLITTLMFSQLTKQKIYRTDNKQKPWADLLEGLGYIRLNGVMVSLISIGIITGIFAAPYMTLLPDYVAKVLSGDVNSYGYLLLSSGVGGMFGAFAMAQFGKLRQSSSVPTLTGFGLRISLNYVQIISGLGLGLSLVSFSITNSFQVAMIIIAIVGAFSVTFQTINNTFLQTIIEDKYRGRVSSIHQLGWGASAFGGLLLGILAQGYGTQFALALCASIATVSIFSFCIYIKRCFNENNISA